VFSEKKMYKQGLCGRLDSSAVSPGARAGERPEAPTVGRLKRKTTTEIVRYHNTGRACPSVHFWYSDSQGARVSDDDCISMGGTARNWLGNQNV